MNAENLDSEKRQHAIHTLKPSKSRQDLLGERKDCCLPENHCDEFHSENTIGMVDGGKEHARVDEVQEGEPCPDGLHGAERARAVSDQHGQGKGAGKIF